MGSLKVTTYDGAVKHFENKRSGNRSESPIGRNTRLRKVEPDTFDFDGEVYFVVKLHQSDIVKLYSDRVEFTLAGWPTVTTRDRINQFLPRNGVHQANWIQYYNGEEIDHHEWYEWRL